MTDAWNMYPRAAVMGMIAAVERKLERQHMVKLSGTAVKDVKINKEGKLEKAPRRMSVSKRIAQRKSTKTKVSKRIKGAQRP